MLGGYTIRHERFILSVTSASTSRQGPSVPALTPELLGDFGFPWSLGSGVYTTFYDTSRMFIPLDALVSLVKPCLGFFETF